MRKQTRNCQALVRQRARQAIADLLRQPAGDADRGEARRGLAKTVRGQRPHSRQVIVCVFYDLRFGPSGHPHPPCARMWVVVSFLSKRGLNSYDSLTFFL